MTCARCKREAREGNKHCVVCLQDARERRLRYVKRHPEALRKAVEASARWSKANRERVRATSKRYAERHPERITANGRKQNLRRKYGITVERYAEMWSAQGGACAICSAPEPANKLRRHAIDHDHAMGKVRQILCHRCNIAIGMLEGAHGLRYIAYLQRHGSSVGRAARPRVVA